MLLFPTGYTPQAGDILGYFSVGLGGTKALASRSGSNITFVDGTSRDASTLALVASTATGGVSQFATITPGSGNTGSGVVAAAIVNPALWLKQGALDSYTISFSAIDVLTGFSPAGPFWGDTPGVNFNTTPLYNAQYAAILQSGVPTGTPVAWKVTNSEGAQLQQGMWGNFSVENSETEWVTSIEYPNGLAPFPIFNDTLIYTPPTSTVINLYGLQLTITGSPISMTNGASDTFTVTPA